jgi:hypothetical protein
VCKWNILENRKFPLWADNRKWHVAAKRWLDNYRKERNWEKTNPIYQREWMAQWVKDNTSFVYRLTEENFWDGALEKVTSEDADNYYIVGIDLGYNDAFVLQVLTYNNKCDIIHHIEEIVLYEKTVSDWARVIKRVINKYHPEAIVADTGGLGKAIVVELQQRFGLPIKAAEKRAKKDIIELLNDDLLTGKVFLLSESKLVEEMQTIQWDEFKRKEDPRYPNDAADAFLYGYREAKHWLYEKPLPKLNMSYNDWLSKEEQLMLDEAILKQEKGQGEWWAEP